MSHLRTTAGLVARTVARSVGTAFRRYVELMSKSDPYGFGYY